VKQRVTLQQCLEERLGGSRGLEGVSAWREGYRAMSCQNQRLLSLRWVQQPFTKALRCVRSSEAKDRAVLVIAQVNYAL